MIFQQQALPCSSVMAPAPSSSLHRRRRYGALRGRTFLDGTLFGSTAAQPSPSCQLAHLSRPGFCQSSSEDYPSGIQASCRETLNEVVGIACGKVHPPPDHQHPHGTQAPTLRRRAQRSRLDTRRRPLERGVDDPAGGQNRRNLPDRRRGREEQHRDPANDPRRVRATGRRLRQGRRSPRTRQAVRRRCAQAHASARLEARPYRLRGRPARDHRLVPGQYRLVERGEGRDRAALLLPDGSSEAPRVASSTIPLT